MKITEKQLIILFDIAKESQCINNGFAGYTQATIKMIVNQIINQQSDELIDVSDEGSDKSKIS